MNILNVKSCAEFDDSITSLQHHAYNPYTTSFNNGDEIRISIQQQDLYLLPSDSYLYIEGNINTIDFSDKATAAQKVVPNIVNNVIACLFDEFRYEINGFEVDRCKNPGITTTVKGFISFTADDMNRLRIAGWNYGEDAEKIKANPSIINYCVPLKCLFGFAEDYKQIVMNAKHELILIRSRDDVNAFVGENNICKFNISKIQWRIPHVYVSDSEKLKLLKIIDRKESIQLNYRMWELHEYPALAISNRHVWSVKTSQKINTPRFIIICFQTNRNNQINMDKAKFDHCEVTDLKVYLNSDSFPYENMNADFANDKYAIFYDMYARFQEKYYFDRTDCSPFLSYASFKSHAPLIVVDCSRQSETVKKGLVDVRIEFQTKANVPNNTTAYCLIIHDNIVLYNPCTNIMNKII